MKIKNRRPDASMRGVTHISTCTGINFHPIDKLFKMGAYLSVIKPPIFLFDHWMLESWNFRHFQKSLTDFELLGSQSLSKFFWKKKKNDEKIFSLFLFVLCSANYIMFPRKVLFTSINSQYRDMAKQNVFFQIRNTS